MAEQVADRALSPKDEIAALVARSRKAQAQIENYTQEQVDALIRAMVWAVAKPGVAEKIAQFTVDETQLGNYDGKFLKIFRKTRATLMDIINDKSVGMIEEIPAAQHREDCQADRRDRRAGALHQPGSNAGHQSHSRRQRPQRDHHCTAPARETDQQDDLRPDARSHREDGRTCGPRASASKRLRWTRPTN